MNTMSKGPLALFRKHQKWMLIIFGVGIIIIFTVGSSIQQMQSMRQGGRGKDPVAVTWKHGELTDSRLANLRRQRIMMSNYLQQLFREALFAEGKGVPSFPDIPQTNAEEVIVQTAILADLAERKGVMVGDQAVEDVLEALTAGKLTEKQRWTILHKVTEGGLKPPQLIAILRRELLAQKMRVMLGMAGRTPSLAATPGAAWEYYTQMNRDITAELMPLNVEDYMEGVGEPDEAEIKELFNEHKDRHFEGDRLEPGFKLRDRIKFQYLRGDYAAILDAEMAKVTDEQVEEYYKANLDEFKKPTLLGDEETDSPDKKDTPAPTDGDDTETPDKKDTPPPPA